MRGTHLCLAILSTLIMILCYIKDFDDSRLATVMRVFNVA